MSTVVIKLKNLANMATIINTKYSWKILRIYLSLIIKQSRFLMYIHI